MGRGSIRSINSIRTGIRVVNRISIRWMIDVRRIVIPTAVRYDGAHRDPDDECPHIARRVARLHAAAGGRGLRDVRNVVNRRARRNRIDHLRHGTRDGPRPLCSGRHEPHALKTQIVDITYLNHLVLCVGGVIERCPGDGFEAGIPRHS
jgi:hypothetical protein